MLTTIISFIFVLGLLVFFHESGHYLVAKYTGVQVEEFALGMGPMIIGKQIGETFYSIRALPLGGYCKLTGEMPVEEEEATEEELRAYQEAVDKGKCLFQKSIGERIAVISMGSIMNFFLAVLLFALIFSIFGVPVERSGTTEIGQVLPEEPAVEAGLEAGDEIIAINGQEIANWEEMSQLIHHSAGEELSLEVRRDGEVFTTELTPTISSQQERGTIGIFPVFEREPVNFFYGLWLGLLQTFDSIRMIIVELGRMITGAQAADVAGPVGIAQVIGEATQTGMTQLMNVAAMISINLGIINLLPLPALDGGRLVFLGIELVRGKPVDPEKEGLVHMIGFVLLLLLIIIITIGDVT